jgi:hypothetical protein
MTNIQGFCLLSTRIMIRPEQKEWCQSSDPICIDMRWILPLCVIMLSKKLPIRFALLVLLTCLLAVVSPVASLPLQIQSEIIFSAPSTENNFPESLTFNIIAESKDSEIVSALLYYSARDETSTTRQVVDVEPAGRVELSFLWDTSNNTTPPSAPIVYRWEVTDSNGNKFSSPEELVYYDDVRFDWQILENENIAVWWHDRPLSFGEGVFQIAQEAFEEQRELFQTLPEYQIRIIVYNNFEEFAEWHSYVSEFTGGQAFPSMAVTTQIVSAYNSVDLWLTDVIPHEISHLYFHQATYHPFVEVPAWLNEGIAQLNEFTLQTSAIEYAEIAIQNGDLLPLWSLSGSFGYREDQVRLAYAESLSVAAFINERYGSDGISKLMASYKSGLSGDEALVNGLGVTLIELQDEWLEWMGVDPALYPAPTAFPTVAWPTPPTWTTPTRLATHTPVPPATNTPAPSATGMVEATGPKTSTPEDTSISDLAESENIVLTPSAAGDPATPGAGGTDTTDARTGGLAICGFYAFPLLLAAFLSYRLQVRKKQ